MVVGATVVGGDVGDGVARVAGVMHRIETSPLLL
jgi:hypothetical protein